MAIDRRARRTTKHISDRAAEIYANNRRKKEPEAEVSDYLRQPAKISLAPVTFLTAPDALMGLLPEGR
jgi:hypothetical protein